MTENLSLRVETDTKNKWEDRAAAQGLSLSEYMRKKINDEGVNPIEKSDIDRLSKKIDFVLELIYELNNNLKTIENETVSGFESIGKIILDGNKENSKNTMSLLQFMIKEKEKEIKKIDEKISSDGWKLVKILSWKDLNEWEEEHTDKEYIQEGDKITLTTSQGDFVFEITESYAKKFKGKKEGIGKEIELDLSTEAKYKSLIKIERKG